MPPTGLPLRHGEPPAWEKVSHLPPGTTKLGNLRDGNDPSQLPLLNQIFGILLLHFESPPRDARNVTGCTGMLDGLVGSHTKVAIYPTIAICCERL